MTTTNEPPTTADSETTLVGRRAASAVIIRTLAEQSWAPRRTTLGRILGTNPLAPDARSSYAGALGELRIGERLSSLGDGWTVLHSVPVGSGESDIDHVVIGPHGAFTINTKYHDDARIWVGERTMMVNGQKTEYLRNARHESDRAAKRLARVLGYEVPVYSAIVIVGAKEWTFRQQPDGIAVLRESELLRWLRKRRRSRIDVAEVAAVAALPDTWHERGAELLSDPDPAAFAALRSAVNRARATRLAWVLGVTAAGVAACLELTGAGSGTGLGW